MAGPAIITCLANGTWSHAACLPIGKPYVYCQVHHNMLPYPWRQSMLIKYTFNSGLGFHCTSILTTILRCKFSNVDSRYILLSPYLCFIFFLCLYLHVLGDDA